MDIATIGLRVDSSDLRRGSDELNRFTNAGQAAQGSATGLIGRFNAMSIAAKAVAAATAAATAASAGIFAASIREAQMFETTMFRIEQIIRTTGGAAGRSADQLREQARQIALSTLESTEGVLRAQQTLLTFRSVQGEVFDRAIESAADMTAALGGDLNSATLQLAKALEDPIRGLTALSRSGTVFTDQQRDMVRAMVEAGDMASAQAFILDELETQYGGTARAAAQGLAGAQDTLAQAFQEFKLQVAESLNLVERATQANNALARVVNALTGQMDRIVAIAGTAAALIGGRLAIGMAIAAARTLTLAGALTTLRTALIRTGFGALIVAAGEMVYQFGRLVNATGSFGSAMVLLGEVAAGVWGGIVTSASAIPAGLAGIWQEMQAGFLRAIADMTWAWRNFVQSLATTIANVGSISFLGQDFQLFGGAADALQNAANNVGDASNDMLVSSNDARARAADSFAAARSAVTEGFSAARDALGRLGAVVSNFETASEGAAAAGADLSGALDDVAAAADGGGGGGAAGGMNALAEAAKSAASILADEMRAAVDAVEAEMERLRGIGRSAMDGLIEGMSQGDLAGGLSGFLGQARGAFMDLPFMQNMAGGIGRILGGAMPWIGAASLASDLVSGFRSSEVTGRDLVGTFGLGGYANTRTTRETSTFWGLRNRTSTSYDFAADETRELREMGAEMRRALAEAGRALGVSAADFRGVKVRFEGDMQAGAEAYGAALEAAIPGLERFRRAGETAEQAMTRLTGALETYNDAARVMMLPELPGTMQGAAAAERYLARAGGASAFGSNLGTIYGMMTPEQQLRLTRERHAAMVRQLGFSGDPNNVDSATDLIGAMRRAQEAGNIGTYARLSQLAPLVQELESLRSARNDEAARRAADKEAARDARQAERDRKRAEALREAEQAAQEAARAEEDLRRQREALVREVAGYDGFQTFEQQQVALTLARGAEADTRLEELMQSVFATLRAINANTARQADDTSILVAQGAGA